MESNTWISAIIGFFSAIVFFAIDRALTKRIKSVWVRPVVSFALTMTLVIAVSLIIKLAGR